MFLFERPKYRYYNFLTTIAIYLPVFVTCLAISDSCRPKIWSISIFLLTIFDEIVFRYLFFLIFSREVKYCLLSGYLYGLYAFTVSRTLFGVLIYTVMGFFYAMSSRKFSVFELIILRYILNSYCLGTLYK